MSKAAEASYDYVKNALYGVRLPSDKRTSKELWAHCVSAVQELEGIDESAAQERVKWIQQMARPYRVAYAGIYRPSVEVNL